MSFLLCTGLVQGDEGPTPVTEQFVVGRRGYDGIRVTRLANFEPDSPHGAGDLHVGFLQDIDHEFRSLLKFTDVNISPGSKIISAQMTLIFDGIEGTPVLAVHGLLKEWEIPKIQAPLDLPPWEWAGNTPSHETTEGTRSPTWNDQRIDKIPWGLPGARKAGNTMTYNGEADHYTLAEAKSPVEPKKKMVSFEVTQSFASQHARGLNTGWLVLSTTPEPNNHAHLAPDGNHRLEVTCLPPPGVEVVVPPPPNPRLITFQLAEPMEIVKNPKRVTELPLEGAVFFGLPNDGDGSGRGWLASSVFGPDPIKLENYSDFIEAGQILKRTGSKLAHNFLRINTAVPGTLIKKEKPYSWEDRPRGNDEVTMWWDEGYEVVLHNTRVAATIALQARLKGILLDWEVYGGNVYDFKVQRDAAKRGKGLEETKIQVRHRAKQFMGILNEVYPDMTLLIIPWLYDRPNHPPEILWDPFADGLIAACNPRMRIVEGNEFGYYIDSLNDFQEMYDYDYATAATHCAVPHKFLKQLDVGFGLYLDRDGWGKDPELNASSASWQIRVENALRVADSYVWIFQNGPQWWSGKGLPQAYIDTTFKALDLTERRRAAQ